MRGRVLLLLTCFLLAVTGACNSVHDLDGPGADLSASERDRVDAKVGAAVDEEEWSDAWNQAVDAGLPRERLEEIALGAVGAKKQAGKEMIERLLEKYGSLTPAAHEMARRLREEKVTADDWKVAARIEVLTAEDAPVYRGAWELYDRAPPDKAPAVLKLILEAREEHGREDG